MMAAVQNLTSESSERQRAGLNGLADDTILRERMGLNGGIEDELRNRFSRTNGMDEALRNRIGPNNNMEDMRSRMGLGNGVMDEMRNGIRQNDSMDGELRSRIGISNTIEAELRNRLGVNSIEEEIQKRLEAEQNRMAFYNSTDMMQHQNHTSHKSFYSKDCDSDSSKTDSEEKSHLDETIEAVARNDFEYDPEDPVRRENRHSYKQFMDDFQIKQEPIDYDLMAANLTAGLMNPDRRHMCPHCCKGFRSRQQLLQHSLVHTNLRKYHCNYCERSFKQLSHLHQHHRIHTGEKPYSCPLDGCGKAFPQLSNLQHHIRNHDKLAESQYQCHLCDRAYPNEATLKAHNTRMHVHSKLISDLQKPPLSQSDLHVSPQDSVFSNIQPRQRKRKASHPQHINNRSAVPFSVNQKLEMGNHAYPTNSHGKEGQENYVYILDSDDDNSLDIPIKKLETSTIDCYGNDMSQKENCFSIPRSEEDCQSKNLQSSLNRKFYGGNNNSSDIRHFDDINDNFRYRDDNLYRSQSSDSRSHGLPKLPNELPRNGDHVTVSSNQMYRNNSHIPVTSNEMPGHRNQTTHSLETSSNNNYLTVSPNALSRNNHDGIISNEIARSQFSSNINQGNNIEKAHLANELQHYNGSMGLDLSRNSSNFSRLYNERSRMLNLSDRVYADNSAQQQIQNGVSENQRVMEDKQKQRLSNGMENFNFNQIMNKNLNDWQRRQLIHQKRLMNDESEYSSEDSEAEMDLQHFQTPNLGADVYDDPMN